MLIWRLWAMLRQPPRSHPLFQRILRHNAGEPPRMTSTFFLWMFTCLSITFCPISLPMNGWIPLVLFGLLLLLNTAISLYWAVNISQTILEEQEHRRYDLLAALPTGSSGVSWAMSTGYLHRQKLFIWLPALMRAIGAVLVCVLIGAMIFTVVVLRQNNMGNTAFLSNQALVPLIVRGFFAVCLLYGDHLYSIVTSVLIGMIAPVEVLTLAEARLRAVWWFGTLQLVFYLLWLAPTLLLSVDLSPGGVLLHGLMSILFYVVLREWLLRWLWRRWLHLANADMARLPVFA
jgi:hypothetical protein